jgi:hypothetical protein
MRQVVGPQGVETMNVAAAVVVTSAVPMDVRRLRVIARVGAAIDANHANDSIIIVAEDEATGAVEVFKLPAPRPSAIRLKNSLPDASTPKVGLHLQNVSVNA